MVPLNITATHHVPHPPPGYRFRGLSLHAFHVYLVSRWYYAWNNWWVKGGFSTVQNLVGYESEIRTIHQARASAQVRLACVVFVWTRSPVPARSLFASAKFDLQGMKRMSQGRDRLRSNQIRRLGPQCNNGPCPDYHREGLSLKGS